MQKVVFLATMMLAALATADLDNAEPFFQNLSLNPDGYEVQGLEYVPDDDCVGLEESSCNMSCKWNAEHNICLNGQSSLQGFDKVNLMTDYVPHTFVTRNGKMNLGLANIKQKAKYRLKKVTLKMNNKKSKKY